MERKAAYFEILKDEKLNNFADYKPIYLDEGCKMTWTDSSTASESPQFMPLEINYDLSDHSAEMNIKNILNLPIDMSNFTQDIVESPMSTDILIQTKTEDFDTTEYLNIDDNPVIQNKIKPKKRIKNPQTAEKRLIIDMMQFSMLNDCNSRINRPFVVYSKSLIKLLNRSKESDSLNDQLMIQRYLAYRQDIYEQIIPQTISEVDNQNEYKANIKKVKIFYDQVEDIVKNIRSNARPKQDEVAIRAAFLERENIRLRREVLSLECRMKNHKK